jgi:erythromycin esterase-like protein
MKSLHDFYIGIDEKEATSQIRSRSHALRSPADLDPLIDQIGDARIVMLGEASHGTHEYYAWRTLISQRLIREKGFNFIAVEGDWPDCYRVNRYVKGYANSGASARDVLKAFNRWPTWMWANWEVVALAEWMREHNKNRPTNKKAGFYGLDVYSLWESMEAILDYLKKIDPQALRVAEKAFECFEPYHGDEGRSYAEATLMVPELCTQEVIGLLNEIRRKSPTYNTDHENVFSNQQNAAIVVNAEKYYRTMIEGGPHSWNVRDSHMMETLNRLLEFHGEKSKGIVWAHNTHVGDARATDMTREGMYNIGELARLTRNDAGVILVGFGSHHGRVIAGHHWGGEMKKMVVPEGKDGSWEAIMHKVGIPANLLIMSDLYNDLFMESHIDHRAIGVVYNPTHERFGNYVPSVLPLRYDAFIFINSTTPLHPLHIKPDGHQMPETYPFGV